MKSIDEIMNMSPEDFAESWDKNEIQDSCLKHLGRREMTEEDRKELDNK